MGRLKAAAGRLSAAGSRLGDDRPASQAEREVARMAARPDRAWYKTARWRALREAVIKRDGQTCQRTGVALVGRYPAGNSPVVDHIRPHGGDPKLFWDMANLQTVSRDYHDTTKRTLERRGLV